MGKPQQVEQFYADLPERGQFTVRPSKPPHPDDRMTATVCMGGGAFMTIINPQSFADGGPEWVMRY
ncbi:hypothetical protein QBK99_25705, partial [Corticibacterium sp. UT-5YL-CI-8]|nr:hypothetical protein [Tianweitania sp. UT-5YL-CI-8]